MLGLLCFGRDKGKSRKQNLVCDFSWMNESWKDEGKLEKNNRWSNDTCSLSLLFCPVWMLFCFNIIGSSLVWFVSKKWYMPYSALIIYEQTNKAVKNIIRFKEKLVRYGFPNSVDHCHLWKEGPFLKWVMGKEGLGVAERKTRADAKSYWCSSLSWE